MLNENDPDEILDELPTIISTLEAELDEHEEALYTMDPESDEYFKAVRYRDRLDEAIQALWYVYDPEQAEEYFGPKKNRENVPQLYAEDIKRKEEICVSDDDVIEQLKRSIVECDTLMTQFPFGSEDYKAAAELKQSYIRHYLQAMQISNERKTNVFEKWKWAINVAKDLALGLIPVAVYVILFHQSLNFESEGSYRSRTTSNLVSKMAPKGLQG